MKKLVLLLICIAGVFSSCSKKVKLSEDISFNHLKEGQPAYKPVEKSFVKDSLPDEFSRIKPVIPEALHGRISEIVKPAKEALLAVLEKDETGVYKAYQQDIEKITQLALNEDKMKMLALVKEKYYAFMKKSWEAAGIEDEWFKKQIVAALPAELRTYIQFEPDFLAFKIEKHSRTPPPEGPEQGGDPAPAPPAPPPAPSKKCIDVLKRSLQFPVENRFANARSWGGRTANLFFTRTDAAIYGTSSASNIIVSRIEIPGDFADDNKLIRIRKEFDWRGFAMAISAGVYSSAQINYSTNWWQWDKTVLVAAPVIWVVVYDYKHPNLLHEETVEKQFLRNIRYGFGLLSSSFTNFSGMAWGDSEIDVHGWQVCEL